jgi:DNA-binding MarR family transcriptional regulator
LTDDEHVLTAAAIRNLLYRRDVAVARQRTAVARTLGLNDVEMLALVHLAEQGELSPSALGNLLDLSSGGATALVQRLERHGHVTRTPHPTDRRSTLIGLTPATADRLDEAESPPYEELASLTAALAEPERRVVNDMFRRLATLSEERARTSAEPADDALAGPVPSLWA